MCGLYWDSLKNWIFIKYLIEFNVSKTFFHLMKFVKIVWLFSFHLFLTLKNLKILNIDIKILYFTNKEFSSEIIIIFEFKGNEAIHFVKEWSPWDILCLSFVFKSFENFKWTVAGLLVYENATTKIKVELDSVSFLKPYLRYFDIINLSI